MRDGGRGGGGHWPSVCVREVVGALLPAIQREVSINARLKRALFMVAVGERRRR